MHPSSRALVAVVAARSVSGDGDAGAAYDHSSSRHILLSGSVSRGEVGFTTMIADAASRGPAEATTTTAAAFTYRFRSGGNVSGYDHGDGHHFSGSVSAKAPG